VADQKHIKAEKAKAQELRHSRWWQQQLQNASCYYCHKALTATEATMDHIVPIADGGRSTKSNVVVCCKDCNNRKKDASFMDWVLQQENKG
jgi:5-methylcytosine-specific restriction endonuclease McrA